MMISPQDLQLILLLFTVALMTLTTARLVVFHAKRSSKLGQKASTNQESSTQSNFSYGLD